MKTPPNWIDLPDDDYVLVLGFSNKNSRKLNEIIKSYNKIKKDCLHKIKNRIAALSKIEDFLNNWIDHDLSGVEKVKHLKWIIEIAASKASYLEGLEKIYSQTLHSDTSIENYHQDVNKLNDLNFSPVFLNKECFFSLKMREYWGDFWLESLDPCHRKLSPFYKSWKLEKKQNTTTPHFFLWLENQHLPKYIPKVRYLNEKELANSKVTIHNGMLWYQGSLANWNNSSERYLFAIDLEKQLFVAKESDGCSHSSFTHGRPVLGAGLLEAKEGQLISIALESGHYLPSVEIGYQICSILKDLGIIWPKTLEIIYFFNRNKHSTFINKSSLNSLNNFIEELKQSRTLSNCAIVS